MTGFGMFDEDTRKKERLTFRLDKCLYERIILENRSSSELIRVALQRYFLKK